MSNDKHSLGSAKIAVVQAPPVLLDRRATLERAVEHIERAADEGARLVVFPETWVPGYPTWIWRLRPGGDMALSNELHARLAEEAVDLSTDQLAPVRDVARGRGVWVSLGVDERDDERSRTTLYNTALLIGDDGEIKNRHRKLMPTNPERMVHGTGDASGLVVVGTPVGKVGTLICWESYMPLARYALYASGLEVLLAPTWDSGESWLGTMQHVAREGRCFVVSCGTALEAADVPADFPGRAQLFPDSDEWINSGDSVVVDPSGKLLAGPHHRDKGLLLADIDRSRVAAARRSLDVAGHYARPDVFELRVDRSRPRLIVDT